MSLFQGVEGAVRVVVGQFCAEWEIKRSRFIATVCGEVDGEQAMAFVKDVKKKYADATHNCYAFIAGENGETVRFSDDGEPSGTAAAPILEVLRRQNLKNTALVVTRYYGGIKLGASGLSAAYARSAALVLENAKTAIKKRAQNYTVVCSFADFPRLESYFKNADIAVKNIDYGESVTTRVAVCLDYCGEFEQSVASLSKGKAVLTRGGIGYEIF